MTYHLVEKTTNIDEAFERPDYGRSLPMGCCKLMYESPIPVFAWRIKQLRQGAGISPKDLYVYAQALLLMATHDECIHFRESPWPSENYEDNPPEYWPRRIVWWVTRRIVAGHFRRIYLVRSDDEVVRRTEQDEPTKEELGFVKPVGWSNMPTPDIYVDAVRGTDTEPRFFRDFPDPD